MPSSGILFDFEFNYYIKNIKIFLSFFSLPWNHDIIIIANTIKVNKCIFKRALVYCPIKEPTKCVSDQTLYQ